MSEKGSKLVENISLAAGDQKFETETDLRAWQSRVFLEPGERFFYKVTKKTPLKYLWHRMLDRRHKSVSDLLNTPIRSNTSDAAD